MLGPLDLTRKRTAETPVPASAPAINLIGGLAEQPGVAAALGFFARERRWIDDCHIELCRIPALTFFEQRRAEWMAARLAELGWTTHVDRAGNVVAQLGPLPSDGELIALTAHLDTVLAPRLPEEIRVESRERFRGPGVADNGAGLAALMAVARALAENPPDGVDLNRLLLVANVGEEGEGNLSGMRYLCLQSPLAARLAAVVVLDGPDTAHVTVEALACRRFELTVIGPGGHSWSDHGAANAVHALARTIAWYADARNESTVEPAGPLSWNFGVIEGGSTVNAIPALARAKVDLRAQAPGDLDELSASLGAVMERALVEENRLARSGRVTGRIKETGSRPAGRLAEDSPLLSCLRAVDQFLSIRSTLDCASTDANIPLSIGLPALSIGTGGTGGGAHTPAEWYSPAGRDLGLRRILLLAVALLADLGQRRR
jgi:acetylornithine deacetylase/succinyl-diaminopimelate desuccinylase-like protein